MLQPLLPLALALVSAPTQETAATTTEPPAPAFRIAWERTVADALEVSRRTGKPILVCVNVGGESASDRFAHTKYLDPDFAALVEGFVPIVCSPERHTPVDHDERGRRVPCPRFGGVTCGEHQAAEPECYARWFGGARYAPRHIGVSSGGRILFDRYLDQDLSVVDEALRRNGQREASTEWGGLLRSRSSRDRDRLEALFLAAKPAQRRAMLEAAAEAPSHPIDLVYLGLADPEPVVRAAALDTLAGIAEPPDLPLAEEVLGARLARGEDLEPVFRVLDRLSPSEPRARRLVRAHRALARELSGVDVAAWLEELRDAAPAPPQLLPSAAELGERLDALSRMDSEHPGDPATALELSRTQLAFARERLAAGRNPTFFLIDARDAARRAVRLGARPEEGAQVEAQADFFLGEFDDAGEAARRALPGIPDPRDERAARLFDVLASARTRSIYAAEDEGRDWPEAWLTEAHTAYTLLARHPAGTAAQAVAWADLLRFEGLERTESEVLHAAVRRFGDSAEVHRRFRACVERLEGVPALEPAYAAVEAQAPDSPSLEWFAGYARMVVAEDHRRRGEQKEAHAAYERAIASFERSVALEPGYADSADHYVSLALAGRARVALDFGDLEGAVGLIVRSIERRPDSAEWEDGLRITPLATLRDVRTALERYPRGELLSRLEPLRECAPGVWSKSEL